MCYFYCSAVGRRQKHGEELFFHESICKLKMNTGGELIWTARRQMPVSGSVGSGKVGPGTGFTYNVFSVLSFVVTGAAELLILHNRTNGSDELFKFSYGSVIFYAIHPEDLLYP